MHLNGIIEVLSASSQRSRTVAKKPRKHRYGGDKFAVLLPDAGQLTTTATDESPKGAFLKIDHSTAGRVTASFGVAS